MDFFALLFCFFFTLHKNFVPICNEPLFKTLPYIKNIVICVVAWIFLMSTGLN